MASAHLLLISSTRLVQKSWSADSSELLDLRRARQPRQKPSLRR